MRSGVYGPSNSLFLGFQETSVPAESRRTNKQRNDLKLVFEGLPSSGFLNDLREARHCFAASPFYSDPGVCGALLPMQCAALCEGGGGGLLVVRGLGCPHIWCLDLDWT